ncbi:MAG: hypothetical protein R3B45_01770 [Bdellovibrionota bacterium]
MQRKHAFSSLYQKLISFTLIYFSLHISACGLQESRYIDYEQDTNATPSCQQGLDAFIANIANPVDSTCAESSCHATTTINGKTLIQKNNENNRAVLLAYTNADANTLYNKIANLSEEGHGGSDQSKELPLEAIQAWLTEEEKCK